MGLDLMTDGQYTAWYGCRFCREWFSAPKYSKSVLIAAQEAYNAASRRSN
jgi:hypothetical protein